MLFLPDNYEDISRYYRNTFVKFRETGDKLFYIQKVNSDRVTGTTADGTPFELLLSFDAPYEVDYVLPHKSYFQMDGYACLLQRIPAKQYQRGISENNTLVFSLRASGTVNQMSISFATLEAFVSKQMFMGLSQAIVSDKISVTLSPRFAYVPASRKIYADTTLVAQLQHKHKLVNCFHKLFKPELELLAKDSSYKVV